MITNKENNAYAILGLQKGARSEEIKQAYLALVKRYDPERHTDRFMVIQRAFDTLREPNRRAQEDVRSFNYVKGQFMFSKEERTEVPDARINHVIQEIERKKRDNEMPAEEADKKLIQAYMMRSRRKVKKKLWAEAIKEWQDVLKLDPTHQRAKNNLLYSHITIGYSYASHGLYDEAAEVWAKAAEMDPDNTEIIHNLALACENAGRYEEAMRYWKETVRRWRARLEREPDNEYLKNCVIEVLRAEKESLTGNDQESAPDGGNGQQSASDSRQESGPAPRRGGEKGIEDYREILRLNPNDFEAQYKIAAIQMNAQKWDEAIKELESLRKKNPRNIEVMNLLGWALLNKGKIDDAFRIWKKARAIDPKNPEIIQSLVKAHMTMGRMLREKGHFTPSLVHLKALERYTPDSPEVHFEIGKTYQMQGNERSAYAEFSRVLQLDPKHKEARNGLSTLKLRR